MSTSLWSELLEKRPRDWKTDRSLNPGNLSTLIPMQKLQMHATMFSLMWMLKVQTHVLMLVWQAYWITATVPGHDLNRQSPLSFRIDRSPAKPTTDINHTCLWDTEFFVFKLGAKQGLLFSMTQKTLLSVTRKQMIINHTHIMVGRDLHCLEIFHKRYPKNQLQSWN